MAGSDESLDRRLAFIKMVLDLARRHGLDLESVTFSQNGNKHECRFWIEGDPDVAFTTRWLESQWPKVS